MPVSRGVTRGLAVLVLLWSALSVSLVGCSLTVEEPQEAADNTQRVAMSTGVAELPGYDVAISAVDFDPPLSRGLLLDPRNPVKLLAAVENRGTMLQSGVVVEAHITSQKGEFTAQDRTEIDSLSPGETKLVEFSGVAPEVGLPRTPSYQITVSVTGRRFDSNQQNNTRVVIVRVTE